MCVCALLQESPDDCIPICRSVVAASSETWVSRDRAVTSFRFVVGEGGFWVVGWLTGC